MHHEHQSLISYLTSKASPSEAAQTLYAVLLLVYDKDASDIITTIRYCLEDTRISGELGRLFQQKAELIKRDYGWLNEYHRDVKYTMGSYTRYEDYDYQNAIELLDAVNDFYRAASVLDRMTVRSPTVVDKTVLDGLPRVIRRLGSVNPEEFLSQRAASQLKEIIERSKALPETEFIHRHW